MRTALSTAGLMKRFVGLPGAFTNKVKGVVTPYFQGMAQGFSEPEVEQISLEQRVKNYIREHADDGVVARVDIMLASYGFLGMDVDQDEVQAILQDLEAQGFLVSEDVTIDGYGHTETQTVYKFVDGEKRDQFIALQI